MKRLLIFLFLAATSLQIFAQHLEVDIFGNLQYEPREGSYKAYLKKDIFNNLIFSDNNDNELTYEKKYLDLKYKDVLRNKEAQADFFRYLIHKYRLESQYKAKFSVDIFDKIIIEDNRNNKVEYGKDIFGHPTYEEKINNVKTSIKRDLSGNIEYQSDRLQASLKKDIFDKWNYSDSSGNQFKFSGKTWNILKDRYGSDEDIILYLINEFFKN